MSHHLPWPVGAESARKMKLARDGTVTIRTTGQVVGHLERPEPGGDLQWTIKGESIGHKTAKDAMAELALRHGVR